MIPPRQPRGDHDARPLAVWGVRAWEADPPGGVVPIEWFLVTNVPVAQEAHAWERVDWYTVRWVIEESTSVSRRGWGSSRCSSQVGHVWSLRSRCCR